jgi:hypothetical protein
VRPLFKDVFRLLQRGKVLEDFVFLEDAYLIALDGVEHFCSKSVHCPHCLSRQHQNGAVSYYHQMLGAAIVHPDFSEVIPLAPEPIVRADGQHKNDCERNAARRWLKQFRKDHPHLPVIIVEDALSSNAPHIRDLKAARCHFLLGVKPGDHAHLFEQVYQRLEAEEGEVSGANQEVRVNFLRCVEITADGEEREWTWVTDLELTPATVAKAARAGRARWRIENETFNTLKNQGYHFEHNYGHGQKNLCTVFALLMLLAFLIDQVQQRCNPLFRAAWQKKGPKCALWEAMRSLFSEFEVESMRHIYEALAYGHERPRLKPLGRSTPPAAAKEPANTS